MNNHMWMQFTVIAVLLTAGNFVWAVFTREWASAAERSFFQAVAVLVVGFSLNR